MRVRQKIAIVEMPIIYLNEDPGMPIELKALTSEKVNASINADDDKVNPSRNFDQNEYLQQRKECIDSIWS